MLSEYDIHVYSFCGQAIQSLVGATFNFKLLCINQIHNNININVTLEDL